MGETVSYTEREFFYDKSGICVTHLAYSRSVAWSALTDKRRLGLAGRRVKTNPLLLDTQLYLARTRRVNAEFLNRYFSRTKWSGLLCGRAPALPPF